MMLMQPATAQATEPATPVAAEVRIAEARQPMAAPTGDGWAVWLAQGGSGGGGTPPGGLDSTAPGTTNPVPANPAPSPTATPPSTPSEPGGTTTTPSPSPGGTDQNQ